MRVVLVAAAVVALMFPTVLAAPSAKATPAAALTVHVTLAACEWRVVRADFADPASQVTGQFTWTATAAPGTGVFVFPPTSFLEDHSGALLPTPSDGIARTRIIGETGATQDAASLGRPTTWGDLRGVLFVVATSAPATFDITISSSLPLGDPRVAKEGTGAVVQSGFPAANVQEPLAGASAGKIDVGATGGWLTFVSTTRFDVGLGQVHLEVLDGRQGDLSLDAGAPLGFDQTVRATISFAGLPEGRTIFHASHAGVSLDASHVAFAFIPGSPLGWDSGSIFVTETAEWGPTSAFGGEASAHPLQLHREFVRQTRA